MKSPPLIPPEELADWQIENIANMWPLANECGRNGLLKSSKVYARSNEDWRKPIEGECKFQ